MVHAPKEQTPHPHRPYTHIHTHQLTPDIKIFVRVHSKANVDISTNRICQITQHENLIIKVIAVIDIIIFSNLKMKKYRPGNKLIQITLTKSRIFDSILVLNYKGTPDSPKAQAEISTS